MHLSSFPNISVGGNFRKDINKKVKLNLYLFVQSQQWNTRAMCEIHSKLTIKTPKRRRRHSGIFSAAWKYY